jgi:hypothetical protein
MMDGSPSSRMAKGRRAQEQKSVVDALSVSLEKAVIKAIATPKADGKRAAAASRRRLLLRGNDKVAPPLPPVPMQDTMLALSSLVGLAIKQGSLTRILQSLILVVKATDAAKTRTTTNSSDASKAALAVHPYLLELQASEPVSIDSPMQVRNTLQSV